MGYAYKAYQYASDLAGTNGLSVNGVAKPDTTSSASDEPTAEGTVQADSQGSITFLFTRKSHQVHLSALTVAETLSTLAENNFNDRGSSDLSSSTTYSYTLANGYPCALTDWTHTRDYAKGFLRNAEGTAQAVVHGLQPGQTYAYKVYQYASDLAGTNGLSVNGVAKPDTTSSASDEPTAEGTVEADSQCSITFLFTRKSHQVH